jgi:cell division protein FtsL
MAVKSSNIKNQEFDLTLYIHLFVVAIFSIALISFRMKCVEMGYELNKLEQDIKRKNVETKELKANKANLLSSEYLNMLAKKHQLFEPDQTQIIVIP